MPVIPAVRVPPSVEVEIPHWLGELLFEDDITKAAGHRYLRRVATGNPARPWRYYYTVAGGHGIGHDSEFTVGAKFRVKHGDKEGHFEIVGHGADGKMRIRHDESGHEAEVDAPTLRAMLHREHAEAIGKHREKLKRDLDQVRQTGTAGQRQRIEAEAARHGVDVAPPKPAPKARAERPAHLQPVEEYAWDPAHRYATAREEVRTLEARAGLETDEAKRGELRRQAQEKGREVDAAAAAVDAARADHRAAVGEALATGKMSRSEAFAIHGRAGVRRGAEFIESAQREHTRRVEQAESAARLAEAKANIAATFRDDDASGSDFIERTRGWTREQHAAHRDEASHRGLYDLAQAHAAAAVAGGTHHAYEQRAAAGRYIDAHVRAKARKVRAAVAAVKDKERQARIAAAGWEGVGPLWSAWKDAHPEAHAAGRVRPLNPGATSGPLRAAVDLATGTGSKTVEAEMVGQYAVHAGPGGHAVTHAPSGLHIRLPEGHTSARAARHMAETLHREAPRAHQGDAASMEPIRGAVDRATQEIESGSVDKQANDARAQASQAAKQKTLDAVEAARAAPLPSGFTVKAKPASDLAQARRRAGAFASPDKFRSGLNGIHVDDGHAIATDGHRLIMLPVTGQVPASPPGQIHGLKEGTANGEFPDYRQVLPPQRPEFTHTVSADALRAVVEAAVAHAPKGANSLPLRANLVLRSEGGQLHALAIDTDEDRKGEALHAPMRVGGGASHPGSVVGRFNSSYLADALKGAKGNVRIALGGPEDTDERDSNSALSLLLIDREDGERHVVMPIRGNRSDWKTMSTPSVTKSAAPAGDVLADALALLGGLPPAALSLGHQDNEAARLRKAEAERHGDALALLAPPERQAPAAYAIGHAMLVPAATGDPGAGIRSTPPRLRPAAAEAAVATAGAPPMPIGPVRAPFGRWMR